MEANQAARVAISQPEGTHASSIQGEIRTLRTTEKDDSAAIDLVRRTQRDSRTGECSVPCEWVVDARLSSGGPGYVGELYILQGDAVGEPPMVLTRDEVGTIVPN